jgi:hypothetical protein
MNEREQERMKEKKEERRTDKKEGRIQTETGRK